MELAGGTDDDKANVSRKRDDHENLVTYASSILKEESDREVLESIVELLEDLSLRRNAEIREGLRGFKKNGWALIRRAQEQKYEDFKLKDTKTTPSMALELKQGKQNMKSRLDHETHPMNNDLILKKIFAFSSKDDPKNCRLVSKKWRDLSLGSWRGKAVLKAWKLFEKSSVTVTDKALEDVAVEIFIKNASKVVETPFQSYDMRFNNHCLYFGLTYSFKVKNEKMMLTYFSSSIQELTLTCSDLDMLCLLPTKVPQLRVLKLEVICHKLYSEYRSIISKGRECPLHDLQSALTKLCTLELDITTQPYNIEMDLNFPWKKFFESVPALKYLALNLGAGNIVSNEVMESLREVQMEGNLSSLKFGELGICLGSSPRCIIGTTFPLQKLSIEVMKKDRNNSFTISELLKAHAETLQYINCYIHFRFCDAYQKPLVTLVSYLPSRVHLPKLKELVIENDRAWALHLLSFLDAPNLEKLQISSVISCFGGRGVKGDFDVTGLVPKSIVVLDYHLLPNLNVFFCDAPVIFSASELGTLSNIMPNLADLRIGLGKGTFPTVYQSWRGLKSLHVVANGIINSVFNDYTVTGVDMENPCGEFSYGDDICEMCRKSNITDLKNLRKFVLETRFHGRSSNDFLRPHKAWITDFSAIHGFLKLPKLETLHLEIACKFSPRVMVALDNHVSDIKISWMMEEPDEDL